MCDADPIARSDSYYSPIPHPRTDYGTYSSACHATTYTYTPANLRGFGC